MRRLLMGLAALSVAALVAACSAPPSDFSFGGDVLHPSGEADAVAEVGGCNCPPDTAQPPPVDASQPPSDTSQPPPVTPDGSTATFRVTYPGAVTRQLNVQAVKSASDLGKWWDKTVNSAATEIYLEFAHVAAETTAFRFNVSQDNVKWLCMGNGSTATLDPDAGVGITYLGKNYTKADLVTWSAPGGTVAGCSACLPLKPGACASP